MQPPYQPSGNKPPPGDDPAYADPAKASSLPPQREQTIGDLLSAKGVNLGLVCGRLTSGAGRQEREPRSKFSVPSPAVQLFRRDGPRQRGAGRAPKGWRARRQRIHQGGRRGEASAGCLLQAAWKSKRAPRLHRCAGGRPATSPRSSRSSREVRNGRVWWSSSHTMKTAASGIMSRRRRRGTVGVPVRASRR